jgi:hypothetical protein
VETLIRLFDHTLLASIEATLLVCLLLLQLKLPCGSNRFFITKLSYPFVQQTQMAKVAHPRQI